MLNTSVTSNAPVIPTIDISGLFGNDGAARKAIDDQIMAAASGSGFMVATGLPDDCLSPALRKQMLSIFALSDAEKHRLCRTAIEPSNANIYRGWFPLRHGDVSYKEGIDIGPDIAHGAGCVDPSDPLTEATPVPGDDLLPDWQEAIAIYYRAMEQTGAALMRSIARGLELPEQVFASAFEHGISSLRLARYPVRTDESFGADADALRVQHGGETWNLLGGAHADSGFITLVAQDGVEGLQAQLETGEWLTVPPTEGAVAVNFGLLLERWTDGRIKATQHRVIGRNIERFSVPFFYEPAVDAVIAPIKGLTSTAFEPFSYGDHLWQATTKFVEQAGIAHLRTPKVWAESARIDRAR